MSTPPVRAPRLLIVTNVSWFFVMHRLPIALMARERGFEVHVACGEGKGAEDIIAAGLPFHPLPLTRTAFAPFRDLRTIWSLVRLYRRLRPDIVHHVTLKPIMFGSIAARIARVPSVLNAFAGLGFTFTGTSLLARLRRYGVMGGLSVAMGRRDKVVFENSDDRSLMMNGGVVSNHQSSVISGVGVDTEEYRFSEEPAGPVNIVFASRMLREKGVEYFVAAARRLKKKGIVARFVLVGTPDPFNPGSISEGELRAWQLEGVVEWEGFRSDMPTVLREAHVVCLPTYYREGVPRVLLEGAACGRALVATDMPGCRDIVRHNLNGLLVQPHETDQLEQALEYLISDGAVRRRMGAEGRALVEREFSLPFVLQQFWLLYQELGSAARRHK